MFMHIMLYIKITPNIHVVLNTKVLTKDTSTDYIYYRVILCDTILHITWIIAVNILNFVLHLICTLCFIHVYQAVVKCRIILSIGVNYHYSHFRHVWYFEFQTTITLYTYDLPFSSSTSPLISQRLFLCVETANSHAKHKKVDIFWSSNIFI